ncbi:MAG: hypothetical protein ACJ8NS_12115 [Chthoniobacterales bacterium]
MKKIWRLNQLSHKYPRFIPGHGRHARFKAGTIEGEQATGNFIEVGAIALDHPESSNLETFGLARYTVGKVVGRPVVLMRTATGGQYFNFVTTRRQARREMPGVLFGAAFQIPSKPWDDDSEFHLAFGL